METAQAGTLRLVPFEARHLSLLRVQDNQRLEFDATALSAVPGDRWTAVVDGLPICCGGLVPIWPGRAYAWSVLDREAGPHMRRLTTAIRSLLDGTPWRRIEMAVDAEFEAGLRWARLLGFVPECLARSYLPTGRDAWVFVRL